MFIHRTARIFVLFLLASSLRMIASAQQTQPANDSKPQSQSSAAGTAEKPKDTDPTAQGTPVAASTNKNSQDKNAGTSNDRLFLALPNFLTLENAGKVAPLTTGQKFKVVARGTFDKVEFPWYGALAGISQAENSEPGYGQGWEGYAKRYGSAFADGTIENFMVGAVMPSILHQDPRFFQTSEGGFAHRAGYAVSRIFVTRTDSGHSQFNYSEIIGSALSAGISTNTYHPRSFITTRYDPSTGGLTYIHNASDRTLPNTLSVWGTQVGYDTITIVIKEFWPDVHRKMTHKHKSEVAPTGSPNP
ncbi:MAG: hypothetical protein ABSH02_15940 [Candidatus Sulfotelmatobacter sp.]